jgi:SAM-dependent methyltransferase
MGIPGYVVSVAADGAQTFRVSAEAYDGHVGRYGQELARELIGVAGVINGMAVLDVGCGTGLLTAELADIVGVTGRVAAIDPSAPFAQACHARVPTADVREGRAESLPFNDGVFDAALAQLVVNFMTEPAAGVREMRRVTRKGGVVASAVWDYAGEMTLLRAFWDAAIALDPAATAADEGRVMRYCDPDSLAELWRAAGLTDVTVHELRPSAHYDSVDALWRPFTQGVAPSGAYTAALPADAQAALRDEYLRRLGHPTGSFTLTARAWAVRGSS